VAVAVPKITTEFHSTDDVAWYGSAYMLGTCCFQLLFGKLYAGFSVKWVYLSALFIFEVGSVVCAAAPTSLALIIGRVLAGVGAAGLVNGGIIVSLRPNPRPDIGAEGRDVV
jgi:MFS family permease